LPSPTDSGTNDINLLGKETNSFMRTRAIVLLVSALLIISVLAACGATPSPTATAVPPTATKAPAAPTATTAPAAAPTATKAPAPTTAPAAAPTATKAPAAAASPTGASGSTAKQIPHPVAGMENCLQCHAAGGVKPVPASHKDYQNAQCQTCHKPKP
jgi:hypothetical protein